MISNSIVNFLPLGEVSAVILMSFSTLQLHRLFKVHVISVTFFYLAQSSQVFLTLTCLSTLQKRLFIDIFISEKNKNDPTQPGMGLVLGE